MGRENLAPIDSALSIPTKQYVDDVVAVSNGVTPTAPNTELWVDTSVARSGVTLEEFEALMFRVSELERRLL